MDLPRLHCSHSQQQNHQSQHQHQPQHPPQPQHSTQSHPHPHPHPHPHRQAAVGTSAPSPGLGPSPANSLRDAAKYHYQDLDQDARGGDNESAPKRQKRNKPTLSCHECVERKTKVGGRRFTLVSRAPFSSCMCYVEPSAPSRPSCPTASIATARSRWPYRVLGT